MTQELERFVKDRLRVVAREGNHTFAELWHKLILERFLARIAASKYKDHFVFKGGSLLARYIAIERETRDLDFLVQHLSSNLDVLDSVIKIICSQDIADGFSFEKSKITPLTHPHMNYDGAQVYLIARLGNTKTHLTIDLGFGDVVEPVDQSISLTSTSKGPLFESSIKIRCYPKEFIFAEKIETVIYRGETNSRMKDFHDLYSLTAESSCLDPQYTERVILDVFRHRKASISSLPLRFRPTAMERLGLLWRAYHSELSQRYSKMTLPVSLEEVVDSVNDWLQSKTALCHQKES